MARATVILALLMGLGAPSLAAEEKGPPVQKVIEMMNEMLAKGKAEKEAETKLFNEYAEWVDDESRETGFTIKTAKADIEELTAEAEKADADVADLTEKIAELDGQIAGWEADQKAATELRESEKAEYLKVSTDYGESVDALDRAINVLEKQAYARPQAEMLLQKMAVNVPGMQRVLAAFLEMKSNEKESLRGSQSGGPAVAAYEFQSGGIIEMLEKLKKKFKAELDTVETEEANKAHAYDLEMLHLGNSIEAARADRNKKAEVKAQRAADSAEAKGKLADTKAELEEAEKYLADLEATFKAKTSAYEANQKVRAEEIEAIAKAIEIISSPEVSGAADKHLPGLVQQAKAVSLLQMSRSSEKTMTSHRDALRQRVVEFLRKKAEQLGSKVLSMAAVQAGFDPFAKVIDMIKKLIARLEEEAAAEAGHKAWCDEELKTNKMTRDAKTSEVQTLTAAVEKLEGEIAALAKAMKEATEIRTKEKEENLQTIKDAKEAQEAVEQALVILKDFYAKQAGLLQEGQVPEMKEYKGMGGSSKGVIGMLEVILSDFARLEAETTADENQAQKEYDQFMADSKASQEAMHDEEFDKGLIKDKKEHEAKLTKEDLAAAQEELDAALKYYEELKPMCLEVHVSYEERAAKRQEEIEALQEAYKILSEER